MSNVEDIGLPVMRADIPGKFEPVTDYEYISTQIMASLIQNETMSRMVHQDSSRQMIVKLACDLADALVVEIKNRKSNGKIS
ncbi:MAG: hypothetical protein QNJ60_11250 [Xenococcaceae cyanobacterium MO_188.B19]|nr:hypothetical protein [Xenococcaceae cyanobacterium MO_188.B19]MDJ0681783.1 hypothetical protein [Xenococcaceae cyanobacterium MO_167.B52]